MEGEQRGTSHAPPPNRIQHHPREKTHGREGEHREKEKNTKQEKILVSERVDNGPDYNPRLFASSERHEQTNLYNRLSDNPQKNGEPKLHVNILRFLVTAAESCESHRQQTAQWPAVATAFTSSATNRNLLLKYQEGHIRVCLL